MITINVSAKQTTTNLANWIAQLETRVGQGVANAAYAIERQAKLNLQGHTQTGTLHRSIQTQVDGLEAAVSSNLDYAPYVEQGTGIYADGGAGRQDVPWTYYDERSGNFYKTCGIQPVHFLQDAVNAISPKIAAIIQQELNKL